MSSIILLKPILDVLYEDANALKTANEQLTSKLCKLEKDLEEKNTEISTLYNKNRELEHLISKYELHFETLSSQEETPNQPQELPKEPAKEHPTQPQELPKEPAKEPAKEPPKEPAKESTGKRSRKDYMREYQRAYRKKQKDLVFNL